jgi:hypothetical protein
MTPQLPVLAFLFVLALPFLTFLCAVPAALYIHFTEAI